VLDLEESGLVERARRGDRPHRAPTRRMLT
jgi:hypothetical protein